MRRPEHQLEQRRPLECAGQRQRAASQRHATIRTVIEQRGWHRGRARSGRRSRASESLRSERQRQPAAPEEGRGAAAARSSSRDSLRREKPEEAQRRA